MKYLRRSPIQFEKKDISLFFIFITKLTWTINNSKLRDLRKWNV